MNETNLNIEVSPNTNPNQAATSSPPEQSILITLFPFILMIGVLYLLIIRPQQKQKREHQNLLENLKVGDKVVTTSGMIGRIANIKNEKNIVVLRVDDTTKTKIEFQKSSIVAVLDSKDDDNDE